MGYYIHTNPFEDEFQHFIYTITNKAKKDQPSEDKVNENETLICTTKEFEDVCKELGLEED